MNQIKAYGHPDMNLSDEWTPGATTCDNVANHGGSSSAFLYAPNGASCPDGCGQDASDIVKYTCVKFSGHIVDIANCAGLTPPTDYSEHCAATASCTLPPAIVEPTSSAGGCCMADQLVTNTITAPQAASQVKFTLYQADNRNKPIKDVKFRCRDNAYQTLQASQITVNKAGREFTVDTPVTQGQMCDIQFKSIVSGSDHYTKVVYGTGYSSTVVAYGTYPSLDQNNDGFIYNVKQIEFN
jgi:hypothetical protein